LLHLVQSGSPLAQADSQHMCHLLRRVGFYLVHRSLAECHTIPSKLARKVLSYLCHGDWLHGEEVCIARTFHLHNTASTICPYHD
jgi:hypothetical protein